MRDPPAVALPTLPTLPPQSGTVAAAAAIASVTPHGTGAIDVVMVRHTEGDATSISSSPFYVRFGKYTGARSSDRRVRIEVNGKDVGFCMHLGRTGEAWFLAQGESNERGDSFFDRNNRFPPPPAKTHHAARPCSFPYQTKTTGTTAPA